MDLSVFDNAVCRYWYCTYSITRPSRLVWTGTEGSSGALDIFPRATAGHNNGNIFFTEVSP